MSPGGGDAIPPRRRHSHGNRRRRGWFFGENRMNRKLATCRRWTFRMLGFLMLAWGTFAAVVAFAVRYQMGPFAADDPALGAFATNRSIEGIPSRCRLTADEIRHMPPPSAIADAFFATLRTRRAEGSPGYDLDPARLTLALDWRSRDSTAVWTATYKAGCDCPHAPDSTKFSIIASIDPLTAHITQLISQGITLLPSDSALTQPLTDKGVRP